MSGVCVCSAQLFVKTRFANFKSDLAGFGLRLRAEHLSSGPLCVNPLWGVCALYVDRRWFMKSYSRWGALCVSKIWHTHTHKENLLYKQFCPHTLIILRDTWGERYRQKKCWRGIERWQLWLAYMLNIYIMYSQQLYRQFKIMQNCGYCSALTCASMRTVLICPFLMHQNVHFPTFFILFAEVPLLHFDILKYNIKENKGI